ncbi:hypothetical protein [Leptospira jelokensis]|uniref:Uncharacterized protein n=1 Tax=Leptospira jelokensis TaxID=2484931 RepID=A0A4Z0ZVA3_9LEPT|nr:hypothetical protein [Leptospira jelokensis]TGL69906.1 hypothetical protein EHQ62_07885 [Leptospira jelokensis]
MKHAKFLILFLFVFQCSNLGKSGIGEETMLGRDIFDELTVYIGIYGLDVVNDRINYNRRILGFGILARWPDAMGVSYQKRDLSFPRKAAKACIRLSSAYLIASRDPSGTLVMASTCQLKPVSDQPLP